MFAQGSMVFLGAGDVFLERDTPVGLFSHHAASTNTGDYGDIRARFAQPLLRLMMSDARVYEPRIRARLGTTAHF